VHTGQHYDEKMARLFFEELAIPRPDVDLEVGSASHAQQTALILARFEPVLLERRPDLVLVVGDVNSTLACSLCASKLGIPVAHVEAGLRSFDRTMPEEINRLVTDAVADLLFVSEPSGLANLKQEGVPEGKVHFVGNVMIDTLRAQLPRAKATDALRRNGPGAARLRPPHPAPPLERGRAGVAGPGARTHPGALPGRCRCSSPCTRARASAWRAPASPPPGCAPWSPWAISSSWACSPRPGLP
jgi:UDP-N-acetylglucosamine 2-epimerase (non-hydrolysing)